MIDLTSMQAANFRVQSLASDHPGLAAFLVHCAPFCCIQEALALRRVSRLMREVVNRTPWHDLRTLIEVDLALAGLQGSVGLKLEVQRLSGSTTRFRA